MEQWAILWHVQFNVQKCECNLFSWEKCAHWSGVWCTSLQDTPSTFYRTSVPWCVVWWVVDMEAIDSWVHLLSQSMSLVASVSGIGDWTLFFLWFFRGAILPMILYGAQCWACILCSSTRLVELDSVLACAVQMAFKLECTTSMEALLHLNGIQLARYHILWLLVHYLLWWWCKTSLVDYPSNPIYC